MTGHHDEGVSRELDPRPRWGVRPAHTPRHASLQLQDDERVKVDRSQKVPVAFVAFSAVQPWALQSRRPAGSGRGTSRHGTDAFHPGQDPAFVLVCPDVDCT